MKNFIVFEGLDGAGTTTQLHRLEENLKNLNIPHKCTFEPTDGEIGKIIRQALSSGSSGENKKLYLQPETLALLFAADRNEHLYSQNGILEALKEDKIVICDRYVFSSLAYQSIECVPSSYPFFLNERFPLPGLLIFINTPTKECISRLSTRRKTDIFETEKFQAKVGRNYQRILDSYREDKNGEGMKIIEIDGTKEVNDIGNEILRQVLNHING